MIAALVLAAAPAAAQDLPGAVDLPSLARGQVADATARGYAERGGGKTVRGPNGAPLTARARAFCDDYPAVRARLGADDARVTRLAAACRRAGYRY